MARKDFRVVRDKFAKLNEMEGDVAERLYLMSLHGRLLLVRLSRNIY